LWDILDQSSWNAWLDCDSKYCLGACTNLGRNVYWELGFLRMGQQIQNFGAIPVDGRRVTSDPLILTAFLCTLQPDISKQMLLIAKLQHSILSATCNTGRVANTYPDGISTRSSIRPCQSACARICSSGCCDVRPMPFTETSRSVLA